MAVSGMVTLATAWCAPNKHLNSNASKSQIRMQEQETCCTS